MKLAIPCDISGQAIVVLMLCLVGCSKPEDGAGLPAQAVSVSESATVVVNTLPHVVDEPDELDDAIASPPEIELAEFPADVNFFAMPNESPVATTVVQQIVSNDATDRDSIRLIGFVNTNPSDPTSTTFALLKVGERLLHVGVGEKFAETELLAIEGRSVLLQRGSDRWTLAMMQQSVMNQAIIVPRTTRRSTSTGRRVASRSGTRNPAKQPDRNRDLPSARTELDLPETPPMPDLPALPDLPEVNLPGI